MSNAKVQFTVKMEDIPKEVKQRLDGVAKYYDGTGFILKTTLGVSLKDSPIAVASKIEEIRKDISFIDAVLQDCYNILLGYSNYQTSLLESSNEISQENTQGRKDE